MKHKALISLVLATLAAGCGPSDTTRQAGTLAGALVARRGTLVVDTCTLNTFQSSTLMAPATQRVVREVVLLCLSAQSSGAISPTDPAQIAEINAEATQLRTAGYQVSLGLTLGDSVDAPYTTERSGDLLADKTFIAAVGQAIGPWAAGVDRIDINLPPLALLPTSGVTDFVSVIAAAIRPQTALGVFVPPSVQSPSDVPGGDSYDLAAIAPLVDRIRVMTLDYSCCNATPGPTIDPGWAVDAMSFAASSAGAAVPLDVAVPLYGTDFSALGLLDVSYSDAIALASTYGATIQRGPTGAPFFDYSDEQGVSHSLWFDDTASLLLDLGAWDPSTLSPDVGVLYYSLGSEDPTLWSAIAGDTP